jgi:hypothetical protein
LGSLGGGAVGTLIGMPSAGASVGSGMGAALSKWLGSGDYTVSQNSIVSSLKASGNIPSMHKNDQTVVIRHKEYLGELKSSTDFTVQYQLELNPGMANTFPWLSTIAGQFQQYRIKGMVYHYIPSSGNAVSSTNNALGTVMFQTSYRSNENAPATKLEMLNEYLSTETVPSETMAHPIECNPEENPFNVQYVRQGVVPANDNVLLYDLGKTYIATSGQQAVGVVLGDVWVTYEVELKKPVLFSNRTLDGGNTYRCTFANPTSFSTSFTPAPSNISTNFIGLPTFTGRSITFAPSQLDTYWIFIQWQAVSPYFTGPLNINGTPVYNSNCAAFQLDTSGQNDWEMVGTAGAGDGTQRNMTYCFSIRVSDATLPAQVTIPAPTVGGTAPSIANVNMIIVGFNNV